MSKDAVPLNAGDTRRGDPREHFTSARMYECDLLVIGSGAGGLSAAVTAAHLGLKVIVMEKAPVLGGTTAWSGGWMWVPRNPLAVGAGLDEPLDEVRRYLQNILGAQYAAHARRLEMFLAHAPSMVRFYLDHTALRFVDGNQIPDFHGKVAGARTGGRSVCAAPFDARQLDGRQRAQLLRLLRQPRDILSFLGMSIGADVRHFMRANRAADSFVYVARRLLRHGWDCLRYGQGTLRMGGNALVAGLLRSALDKGVQFLTEHQAQELIRADGRDGEREGGRVMGVRAACTTTGAEDDSVHFRTRCGVVLACGGFPHDTARKAALFAHAPTGKEHWSAAPETNTGDGIRLAENAGGVMSPDTLDAGAWAPVSLVPRKNGQFISHASFPHLLERGKPGLIAVTAAGKRFVNEAGDYHSFMRGLFAHHNRKGPVQAWLICDHHFQRRWGLGFAKPRPLPLAPYLKKYGWMDSYLQRADTLRALAGQCGIDPDALERTVAQYNEHAQHGKDIRYGRGSTPYERMQGDKEYAGPNPCVAPIARAPFYAVRIVPGSLGTFAGLATSEHAQVLDAQGCPIPSLYAAGNDMASIMGGHYPSGGITLGPAMTFGWILAHHAAGQPLPPPLTSSPDV